MITFTIIFIRETRQTFLTTEGRCPGSWRKLGPLNALWVGFRLLDAS